MFILLSLLWALLRTHWHKHSKTAALSSSSFPHPTNQGSLLPHLFFMVSTWPRLTPSSCL